MTATIFSAVATNVLADEDDGEEKIVESLNPCVATNEYIHIVWQENLTGNYEIYVVNDAQHNYEVTLTEAIEGLSGLDDKNSQKALENLNDALNDCLEQDYKHSIDNVHKAVKNLEKAGNIELISTLIDVVRDFAKTNILYAEYDLSSFNNSYIQESWEKYYFVAVEKYDEGNYDAAIKQFKNAYLKIVEAYEENDETYIGVDFGKIVRISYTNYDSVAPQIFLNGTINVCWEEIMDSEPHVYYARSSNNGKTWWYFDSTEHASVYLNYCNIDPATTSIENIIDITCTLERIYILDRSHYFYVPIREPYPAPLPSGATTFYTAINDVHGDLYDHYEPILFGDKYFFKPRCRPGGDPTPPPKAPDLTVSDLSFYSNTAGTYSSITASIKNMGDAELSGSLRVTFYDGDILLADKTITTHLGINGYIYVPASWSSPIGETRPVTVVADPNNDIYEGDEYNNQRTEDTLEATCRGHTGTEPWYYYFGENSNIMQDIGAKVNTANGNLYISSDDITIKDGGIGIKILRVYNSQRSHTTSSFGNGWTYNYNTYLIENVDQSVTWVDEDGSVHTFVKDATGSYLPPAGVHSKLTKNTDNTFSLRFKDGQVYNFNTNGILSSIVDKKDNRLTFTYDTGNKLTSITDNWGETITLTYDTQGRISSITDLLNRKIQYLYATNGNLVGVVDAMGCSTTYSYYSDNKIKTITDPEGGMTLFTYYETGIKGLDRVKEVYRSIYNFVTGTSSDTFRMYLFDYSVQDASVINDRGFKSRVEVNSVGNPTCIAGPDGYPEFREEMSWDENMNKVGFTDANGRSYTYTYDQYGNLLNETNPTNGLTTYEWNNIDTSARYISLLISKINPNGYTTTYTHDNNYGTLVQETDPTENSTEKTYQKANLFTPSTTSAMLLSSEKDFSGIQTNYFYDSYGNKIKTENVSGIVIEQRSYDTAGRMVSITDGNTRTTSYVYDAADRITKITDASGSKMLCTYDKNGDLLSITDKKGNTTTWTQNILMGRAEKVTDALGYAKVYGYDKNGNLISVTDENGNVTSYYYDSLDRMVRVTDAKGYNTIYQYDAVGNILSVMDRNGRRTNYGYDALNRKILTMDALGNVERYTYDAAGNMRTLTNAKGLTTTYLYDKLNRNILRMDANGVFWRYGYDANGNLIGETDGNGHTTRYVYDARNQLTLIIDPLNHVTRFIYDNVSNKICSIDANNHITRYEYNNLSQLISVIDPSGSRTSYYYDSNGNLLRVVDANNNSTSFGYDALNRVTKIISPLGFTTTYTYDKVGNVVSKTDANGKTISYYYDAVNRLVKTVYPDNSFKEYKYDNENNIIQSSHNGLGLNDTLKYAYDGNNRLTSLTILFKSFEINMNYEYDRVGNKIKKIEPSGTISYEYDVLNRLTKVTDYSGSITTYSYDNAGRRTGMNYPNGVSTVYTYDDASRLLKLENKKTTAVLSSYEYTYDNAGNRLSMLEKNGDKTTYIYDSNDRLVSVSYPSGRFVNYTYDSAGNRITERMEYGTTWNETDYYYDEDNRLVRVDFWAKGIKGMVNQVNYFYDNNGNLISKVDGVIVDGVIPEKIKTTNYKYDFENRLTKVITPDANLSFNYCSCPTLAGIDSTYGDCGACADSPSGKRISKTVNGETIYTICFDPTMDLDVNGNIIAKYVQNPTILDEPISIQTGSGKYYYLVDGLGSVTGLTDSNGNLVATYKYDAFGNIISETGDATLNAINPYRFTSRVYDKEAGLYYYRARYYDAKVGRFTQKDPLRSELTEGNNLYVYVGNNPVNRVDPSGTVYFEYCVSIAIANALYIMTDKSMDSTDNFRRHCYVGCMLHWAGCSRTCTWTIATTWEYIEDLWPDESVYDQDDITVTLWGWDNYWQTKWVSRWWGGYYRLKSCQEIAKGKYS